MSLSNAVLGALNMMPMTGYDLKKFFDLSINFFWSSQMSQIYRELKTLEEKGYVVSKEAPSKKGPRKKVYRITKQGTASLREWLLHQPDSIDEDNRNAFLLRIFLLSNVGLDELHSQIRKRLEKYRKDLGRLEEIKAGLSRIIRDSGVDHALPFATIALKRGLHDVSSHIQWAEESLRYLGKLKSGKK